jgi:PIN domain nuclease of toxin-antitoxin system
LIVLDTHVWVWWNSDPAKLSATARAVIEDAEELGVSAISCWEVSMLVAKGRLGLDRDLMTWVREALPEEFIRLLPISASIGVTAGALEDFHGDPADRLIVATSLELGATLVTKDTDIRAYDRVKSIW